MKLLWSDPDTLHWPTWTSIFLELNPFSLDMHSLLLINITQGFTGFRIRFLTKWLYQNHTLKCSKYVIVCWKQKHIHTCHVPKLECSRYRLTWIFCFLKQDSAYQSLLENSIQLWSICHSNTGLSYRLQCIKRKGGNWMNTQWLGRSRFHQMENVLSAIIYFNNVTFFLLALHYIYARYKILS